MAKFKVINPIKHDGDFYGVGETIEIEGGADVKSLTALGAIAPFTIQVPTDETARLSAVKSAIQSLDRNNEKLWLKNGSPDLVAVENVLGWAPTAAERDSAWTELQG